MNLPFSAEQFLAVFARYNVAVWPVQLVLFGVAVATVVLALRGGSVPGRIVSACLALLWAWMGVAYHLVFFSEINPAAWIFGAVFLAAAAVFGWIGCVHGELGFRFTPNAAGVAGAVFIAFALVGYPLMGLGLGQRFPAFPTFGLPCPTTIFTLGVLLWATPPLPRSVCIAPIAWAVVGTLAAFELGIGQDVSLALAAIGFLAIIARRRPLPSTRRSGRSTETR